MGTTEVPSCTVCNISVARHEIHANLRHGRDRPVYYIRISLRFHVKCAVLHLQKPSTPRGLPVHCPASLSSVPLGQLWFRKERAKPQSPVSCETGLGLFKRKRLICSIFRTRGVYPVSFLPQPPPRLPFSFCPTPLIPAGFDLITSKDPRTEHQDIQGYCARSPRERLPRAR